MHKKLEHLFTQKFQRQNKLPISPLSLFLQILFNVILVSGYLQATLSINLIVTFNFLFIFFDRNFLLLSVIFSFAQEYFTK